MNVIFTTTVDKFSRESIPFYKASIDAAGYDMYSFEDTIIPPNSTKIISTGIKLAIPEGFYGKICTRSSLAKGRVTTSGGIIDSDYRGIVNIIVNNNNDSPFHVNFGDRIAQIIFQRHECVNFDRVSSSHFETLCTQRGEGGFGSTGK